MMVLFLFGVSGGEMVIIFLVILLLFGADKLPEMAKTIGKGMNEVKKATDEIKREITASASEMKDEIVDVRRQVNTDVQEVKNQVISDTQDDPYNLQEDENDNQPKGPEIKTTRKRQNPKRNIDSSKTGSDPDQ